MKALSKTARASPMPASSGSQRATIADVARRAGVSIATVSRVLNGTSKVADTTAERVRAAIAELHYVPRAAARGLASRRTNTIGLLLPEISGQFFPPLLRGIEAGARENGYHLLIYSTWDRRYLLDLPYPPLGEHNTDGLLVFTDSLRDEDLAHFRRTGFPVVLLYRSPPQSLPIPCITFENKAGARALVDHLIEVHGYRRIAFLSGPPGNEDSFWRELGYRESLEAHGLPYDPSLVAVGGFDEEEAAAAVARWLAEGLNVDAIFAGDDEAASGAIAALQQVDLRVPDDIAVVGFDDLVVSRYLNPPLTTVRVPIEQTGRVAVEQLIRLIRTGTADPLVLLPTQLVIRRSCGCMPDQQF
jgi:DNA-binding LacI/PurR family transcriptional regulator